MAEYEVEICESRASLESHRDSWNDLVSNCSLCTPHWRFAWIESWLDAYWQNRGLCFVLVWRDNQLVAAAPLVVESTRRFGVPLSKLRFASGFTTMSNLVIVDDGHLSSVRAITDTLRELTHVWHFAEFVNVPTDALVRQGLDEAARDAKLSVLTDPGRRSPEVATTGDFATFLKKRSRNFRYDIKRASKSLSSIGQWHVRRYDDPTSLQRELDTAYRVSARSWKGDINTSMSSSEESTKFFANLCLSNDVDCRPVLWVLYSNDSPVAIQFHVSDRSRTFMIRSDFDQEYADYRPGFVLQFEVIKDCFSLPFSSYFFGGHDYPYTRRFAKSTCDHVHVYLFNRRPLSRLHHFLKKFRRFLRSSS